MTLQQDHKYAGGPHTPPVQAGPDQAHAIMMTAAGPDNGLTVKSLLTITAQETENAE